MLTLNEVELALLDELLKKCGYTAQEILRMGLRLYYQQEIRPVKKQGRPKAVAKVTPEPEKEYVMSPETYCTSVLNGEIVDNDGVMCCQYQKGVCTVTEPLSFLKVQ